MVQRRRRHNGNFCLIKAEQVGMPDEVVGMCLVIGMRQKSPNVMQQGSVFEQFTFSYP